MNKVNNIYRVIILFLICSGVMFLVKNYNIICYLKQENSKLESLEKKQIKKNYKVDYSEVLSELNCIKEVHILNLTNSNGQNLMVQAEIIGDKNKVKNILTDIKNNKDFYSIGSIKIQQYELQNIKVVADINFKKYN
ncbi:hypothetical protein ACJDU8_15140 [Clostridium sp. WILCCON 0269]|uniref:Uncharacterized protein n=1 Tax=Candidatus Clostridium eludens TaxID=3381663 RepID=A0ABW8SNZ4_9CLOT